MSNIIDSWNNKRSQKKYTKFTKALKRHKGKSLDRWADQLHQQTFNEMDCLDCANCCKSIPPIITKTDSARIAKHLRLKVAEFQDQYVVQDEDGDLVMNSSPCPFLLPDNACSIYEVRPKACRQYPHTDQQTFSQNLHLHNINAYYCPGVHHILEEMQKNLPT